MALEQGPRGWDSCEPPPVFSPSMFCSGNEPAAIRGHSTISYKIRTLDFSAGAGEQEEETEHTSGSTSSADGAEEFW